MSVGLRTWVIRLLAAFTSISSFLICVSLCVCFPCMCTYVAWVFLKPIKNRRGRGIKRSWSYRWLWVLRTTARSLNHWAISPAPINTSLNALQYNKVYHRENYVKFPIKFLYILLFSYVSQKTALQLGQKKQWTCLRGIQPIVDF